jgi:hypothetical protein
MLRLRGDDRVAIITAPLSMTVAIGGFPQRLKPESFLGALTARLEAVPFPISARPAAG